MKMKEKNLDRAIILLMAVLTVILAYNQMQINAVLKISPTGFAVATNNGAATNNVQTLGASVVPTGIPKIYGQELKVSYDDISPIDQQKADTTIRRLGYLDDATQLNEDQMKRYIGIASKISCEYCCGAESIIFSNGQAACGCAHSYAMRGVAKYIIRNHPNEFSDDEILEELGKWKTLFFPGQIQAKAQILSQQGVELNYINLASNKYRGIEQGLSAGGMVGGC
ncbi:hypothetical protein J4458_00595 [Candidatus Woesearchaeota archaeon]|nr:hypothetical protein [Candidatus Woesearchaeota archaeon]